MAASGRADSGATTADRPGDSIAMSALSIAEHTNMERDTLRLLCSVLLKPATRVELCRLLESDSFYEPLQRVIFEEVKALGAVDAKQLLLLLPGRITNRGFPDFEMEDLLTPKLVSEQDIEKLFQSALRLMNLDENDDEAAANPS
jgi:hypothetical protein